MRSRVELFAEIRRNARRTVRQALSGAAPPPRKTLMRVAPKSGPFKFAIDAMLTADLTAPRKQRRTARCVHDRGGLGLLAV